MRICLDARKLWDSGVGTYIRGLLDGLHDINAEIEWDFIVRPGDENYARFSQLKNRLHTSKAREYSLSELFSISKIANRTSTDFFHAPHYVVPLNLKLPFVVTIHDLIHLRFPQYFSAHKRAYARWMFRRVCKDARRILTVSQCTKRDLISEFGTPEEKISVCYVGVSRSYSVPVYEEEISQFIGEYSLPKDYLLFIGNLKPHKNVSGLIEAWAKLPDSVRPVLLIVGEGKKYRLSLERRIQSLGRAKEVFFTGSLPEDSMRPLYRCATACVQPSWYEGFGSPPLEAMASGIPVAVSNRGSLPEIASDAALVFDPGDAESFRHALEKILTDQDLRRSLMEKGLRRAQEFTWERTALMTLQTYREIIQKD